MFTETQVKRCADTGVCPFAPGTDAWYDTLGWEAAYRAADQLRTEIKHEWANGFYSGLMCHARPLTEPHIFKTTAFSIYKTVLRQEGRSCDH